MIASILKNLKYFGLLILITIVILLSGSFIIRVSDLTIDNSSFLILTTIFAVVNGITIAVFFAGQGREKKDQPVFTLASIGLKLLSEMVMALIWFMDEKKSAAPYVLLFFILYLSFSLFSVVTIVKSLKGKAL